MLEILFCLVMFSQCLYMTWITQQLDRVLRDIQEVLRSADNVNAD